MMDTTKNEEKLLDSSSSNFDAVHFIRPKVLKENSPKTFHQGTVKRKST